MKKQLMTILIVSLLLGIIIIPISGKILYIVENEIDFDRRIEFYMKLGHMPSLSTCIIKNNSIIWSKSYGYYDLKNKKQASQDTIYMVASISKMFTAFAIMQLYEKDLLDFDDNINDYLPFKIVNPNYPDVNITFRMLLAHQSSLGDSSIGLYLYFSILGYPLDWINEFLTPGGHFYNKKNWMNYPPGEKYQYSSLGYELLGYLIEQISNQSFDDYCAQNIIESLDMKNTSYHLSDYDIDNIAIPYFWFAGKFIPLPIYEIKNYASGGLKSNICDLSHFLIVHLTGGIYNGMRFLKESTIKQMQTIQYPNGRDGFAWKFVERSDGKTYLVHGGTIPGYHSQICIYPPDSIGVIFSYNQYHGYPAIERYCLIGRIEKYAFLQVERLLFEKAYTI